MKREDYINMVEYYLNDQRQAAYQRFDNDSDTESWAIREGSVVTYIYLFFSKDTPSLRIFAPLVYLPQSKILPLYRACLEANFGLLNCALCVHNDTVGLVVERPLDGLDQEELASSVHYLSVVGDKLDNMLKDDFGAQIVTEAG